MQEFNMTEPGNTEGQGPTPTHNPEEPATVAPVTPMGDPTEPVEQELTPEQVAERVGMLQELARKLETQTGEEIGKLELDPTTHDVPKDWQEKFEAAAAKAREQTPDDLPDTPPAESPDGSTEETDDGALKAFETATNEAIAAGQAFEADPEDAGKKAAAQAAIKEVMDLPRVGDEKVRAHLNGKKKLNLAYYSLISLAIGLVSFAKLTEWMARLAGAKLQ